MTKKALLAVSFGTTYEETRKLTIDAFEEDLKKAFPDRDLFRAWTSGVVRRILRERDGINIGSVTDEMEHMLRHGITDVLVQPSHILTGEEFEKIKGAVLEYGDKFEKISVGAPLIASEADSVKMAQIIREIFPLKEDEMLVLMGHGTKKCDFDAYGVLQKTFNDAGCGNICIGTVEFDPGIAPALEAVRKFRPKKVFLTPLLVVAGDHATNDMAGDEEDSWKNQLLREGVEVECVVKGLGEYEKVRELYIEHAKEADK